MHNYAFHRITAAPRRWQVVAERMRLAPEFSRSGGCLYGLWRSQIGRPRDELSAITFWSAGCETGQAEAALVEAMGSDHDVTGLTTEMMTPTLRPETDDPPVRQGNYAFRWFVTPAPDWEEFLSLCADAWPGFESAYDSQVIGLWRLSGERTGGAVDEASGAGIFGGIRSLLLTRRPDLAMWERSKLPQGAAEAKVRDTLSRRYDLCDWTAVHTTTLLTAHDTEDTARWT